MDDFDEFVAASLEALLKTAYLITWDASEADDLVQECAAGYSFGSSSGTRSSSQSSTSVHRGGTSSSE